MFPLIYRERERGEEMKNGSSRYGTSFDLRLSSLIASVEHEYLVSATGSKVKARALEGKVVGLYFSANWNPECRNFTETLVKLYQQLQNDHSNFEIVFVSSDEDSDAFKSYHSCMPWPAIPFSHLEIKKALNRRFAIEEIPCLVIIQPYQNNEDEEEILENGVDLVYRYGVEAFPFTKQRLKELKDEEREKQENQTLANLLSNYHRNYLLGQTQFDQVSVASLTGKTIGLYFSAKWCLPGLFTPKLISIYNKINHSSRINQEHDTLFEIVFVSIDKNEASFDSYFKTMPWLALPFGDANIANLVRHFDVRDIPCLVIIGPDGKTVTKHGRTLINLYKENAYPFTEARVEVLERGEDEEADKLPRSVIHFGDRHELSLVGRGLFMCCDCSEQGSGWAYQCLQCGFEVHTKCVKHESDGSATVDP